MPANTKHRGQARAGTNALAAQAEATQPSAKYDGPNESPSRGRAPSTTGASARASSRPGSHTRIASQTRRVDPARNPPPAPVLSRNVDFGGQAYDIFSSMPTALSKRNGKYGKLGKKAAIEINSHEVLEWPQKSVYQYDVNIGSGVEKRGLIKAVWMSKAIQEKLGRGFIFDGNKIGWSPQDFGPGGIRVSVDLDKEKGQPSREGRENIHMVRIQKAKNDKIHLSLIRDYLDGKCDFSNGILEAIAFLDHLLRETPSKNLINLRRSYFARIGASTDRTLLGGGVEAMKGIYQTIRMAEGRRLVVNVDVSNSCFWHESLISQLGYEMSGRPDQSRFISDCMPQANGQSGYGVQMLKRLAKNHFIVKHRGQLPGAEAKVWTIKRISNKNAKTHTFDVRNKDTGKVTNMSVFQYYATKYNVRIDKWQLPLLETNKRDVLFPMELAIMAPAQRYPFKLNETQTSNMIKFAVSRPPVRRAGIHAGLKLLNWANDPFLKGYGLKIDGQMLKTNARILDPPEVQFAKNSTAKPLYSGRWDLRGKVFLLPNSAPLKSWGIVVLTPKEDRRPPVSPEQVNAFKKSFLDLYRGHGGIVVEKDPVIVGGVADDADALAQCFQKAGDKAKFRPQMILVILSNKSADVYNRVKRNCDCRFGVMSQCVQSSHVMKNAPQYCSNVLMKFNCKLGGTTSAIKVRTPYFSGPTMIIGADVSHAAPGLDQASMAAMTVSLDKTCSRYGAAVQSNGHRVEMITGANINEMLRPLVDWWVKNVGGGQLPKHVYYFRDGVSEGQYIPLLRFEVADMKLVFEDLGNAHPDRMPKFTVVVAEKRHHIRFFPPTGPAADKNGNPVPGVIIDKDVTLPFENDVYLCSHAAIQGTARPTHYNILMDEMNVETDKFQAMLYEHCYQYQRATTPVSLFPAVYYAHLASKRGESHINMDASKRAALQVERRAHPGQESKSHSDEMKAEIEWPKLMPFDERNNMHLGMWYI